MRKPGALIFRSRLLPWSETFIANQGKALDRYHAVFIGFRMTDAGEAYLQGEDRVVLEEHAAVAPLAKLQVKGLRRVPRRWSRALRTRNPVLVHAHFGFNGRDGHLIADHLGVPLVVTFHGIDITKEVDAKRERDRRRVFENASRIVAVSEFIAGEVRAAGCPPEKVRVNRIGVDTERFVPGPFEERDEATILFVGRLVEKKGLPHLIRAVRMLATELPSARLLSAGDGPRRTEWESQARDLGDRVRFLGVQSPDQVRALLQKATVLAAPSVVAESGDAEGLGMMIVEAQASGVPVVTFESGGTPEGVAHGETGFVVPARDDRALADALKRLLRDPALRQRFGGAARQRVMKELDLATQARRLEAIYDELVDPGSRPE